MSTPTHVVRRPWTGYPAGTLLNPKDHEWRNADKLERHGYIRKLEPEELQELLNRQQDAGKAQARRRP